MTSFVNFFPNAWDSSTSVTLPVTGTDVATLKQGCGVPAAETVAFAHVCAANVAGSSPSAPTFTDNIGLTWTAIHSMTYDGTNGTRHSVYWARVPFQCRLNVTVTLDGGSNVSLAQFQLFTVRGAHITAPQDVNANAIKTESHTSAATSSISGLSTTSADTIIMALYASITNGTDPGDPASHTSIYDRSTNLRLQATYQQVTSVQSSISVSVANSTTTGSLIVFAIRPRDVLRKEITFMQGFDHYTNQQLAVNQAGGLFDANSIFTMSGSSGSQDISVGRDGIGKAIAVTGVSSSGGITRFHSGGTGAGFGVRNPNLNVTNGRGYDALIDDDHIYLGFNLKIGTTVGVNIPNDSSARFAVFEFMQAASSDTGPCFTFNNFTREWGLTLAPGTTGLTSPASVTPDVLVAPDYDPFQKWVWIEVHLYRHASVGRVEMWQESLPFKAGLQGGNAGKRGVAGGHKGRHRSWVSGGKKLQDQPEATLTKIFDFTGDTSVATLGTINAFGIIGDNRGTGLNMGNDVDDFVVSTGDRMRGPCYVKMIPARSVETNVNDSSTVYPPCSAEVTGTNVTSVTNTINVQAGDLIILDIHGINYTDTPPATTISTIVDGQGNSYTNIADVAYIDTAFTPDLQARHTVYWARAASCGGMNIVTTFNGTMDVMSAHVVVIHTNDASPLDTHVDSIKTESHNTSATSSVSGYSTNATAGIVVGCYSSTRSGNEVLTGFDLQTSRTQNGTGGSNTKQRVHTKIMSGAESGATFTMNGASTAGSLIVFCLKNAAMALDTHKSSIACSHQLYESVDDSYVLLNDYNNVYTGNPRVAFGFNSEGVGFTPKNVWAVQVVNLMHGFNDVLDAATTIQQTADLLSGSVTLQSIPGNSATSNLLHKYVHFTGNYDPNTMASWSYTAAKAARAGNRYPDFWWEQETVNRIYGEKRLFMVFKQMLVSQMIGNGAGGVADTPGSPGFVGGNTEFTAVPLTTCFHGIDQGCGPHAYAAELHGLDEGIVL